MATPQLKEKTPHPKGDAKFPEENWIDFTVLQDKKTVKLNTYRSQSVQYQDVKGVMIIFHGLNGHMNNCPHIANAIAKQGVAVVGFDYKGFGKSEGVRGYIENLETLMKECEQFVDMVEKYYPQKKIFLSGQSLGGMVSFLLGVKYPNRFTGSVLYNPAIKDQKANQVYGKKLVKIIGKIIPRTPTIPAKGNTANKNLQVYDDIEKDPYMYKGNVIPGTIRTVLTSMDYCHTIYEKYDTPFLVVQSGIDKLCDPTLADDIMKRSPSKDKKVLFYENAWHAIWSEDEILDIIPKVCDWVKQRI